MVKTSSQMKNMVEDWIKITKIEYRETTEEVQKLAPNVEWQFLVSDVHVTKFSIRDDRIEIHVARVFKKDISTKLVTGTDEVEKMINGINALVTTNGLLVNWHIKDGLVTGFDLRCYIDEQEFERPLFYHTWDRLVNISHNTGISLVRFANPTNTESQINTGTSSGSMYQ